MEKFDVIIIGFGKGGKTLATEFAAQGKKVAMVEKSDKMYGGACPNVGCVPTKFLVNKSEIAEIKGFKTFEEKSQFYKDAVQAKKKLREMILGKMFAMLNNNPNATLYNGTAKFISASELEVTGKDFTAQISADKIIIDTGSTPFIPAISGLKESRCIYTSEGMLDLEELPKHLIVIGGGNIGLEFASFYKRFGSEVTVLQDLTEFMPNEDEDVAKCIKDAIDASGVKIEFGVQVDSIMDTDSGTVIRYKTAGEERFVSGDAILISTGRKPATAELNLAAAGIETNSRGGIAVTDTFRTTAAGVWAIGDVVGGAQFTYVSMDDARIVKSDICGGTKSAKDRIIPSSVFISPSFSRVGLTEKAALEKGYKIKKATILPTSIPRCHVLAKYTGMLKAVVDADTDMILGVSLFCEESHEMVNFVKLAMDLKQPYTVLRDHMFTHPIMSEALNDLFTAVK